MLECHSARANAPRGCGAARALQGLGPSPRLSKNASNASYIRRSLATRSSVGGCVAHSDCFWMRLSGFVR